MALVSLPPRKFALQLCSCYEWEEIVKYEGWLTTSSPESHEDPLVYLEITEVEIPTNMMRPQTNFSYSKGK